MNLRTFSAPSFAQAMALVKTEMGRDAVILHTRTLQSRRWLGLRRRQSVEITAGSGLNVSSRGIRKGAAATAQTVKSAINKGHIHPGTSQNAPNPGKDFLE